MIGQEYTNYYYPYHGNHSHSPDHRHVQERNPSSFLEQELLDCIAFVFDAINFENLDMQI